MLYNAALWFVILAKVSTLFTVLLVLSSIIGVCFAISWGYNYSETIGGSDKFHENLRKASKKVFWAMVPIFIFSLAMVCIVPTTTDLFLIAGMKSVDNYNVKNPSSMISPDGVIGTADNLVKTFNQALTKITATLENKAEKAVESIPEPKAKN